VTASLLLAAFIAMAVSTAATYVVRDAARRLDWLDQPSRRKLHTDPIPLLGGIAMYLAFLVAVPVARSRTVLEEGGIVLAGATLLLIVGIIDDRRGLNPLLKLLAQVAAALLLVLGGIGVGFLPAAWMNVAVTIFWVVGICNAMNLLDNMDGLSAGVAAIACAVFTLLAVIQGQIWVAIVAAVLLGAVLGFLYFNWNPATIFMGDAGSLLLGFMLAVLGLKLRFPEADSRRTWLVPIIILAVPILDTTLVTMSRLRRGISISSGGRDHISHRLVRLGLSVRQSVAVIYLAAIVSGIIAIAVVLLPSLDVALGLVATFVAAGSVVLALLEQGDLSDTGQAARPARQYSFAVLRSRNEEIERRLE
jgi:UDP-GlcNAc:undecaprenyl-phosphate GlcNAc-1-phosphate transferase